MFFSCGNGLLKTLIICYCTWILKPEKCCDIILILDLVATCTYVGIAVFSCYRSKCHSLASVQAWNRELFSFMIDLTWLNTSSHGLRSGE